MYAGERSPRPNTGKSLTSVESPEVFPEVLVAVTAK